MRRTAMGCLALLLLASLATAAEPQVLFEDRFEGKLGPGWSWLREEQDHWRIADGALEIRVQPGKADTVKNALVRKAPDRSTVRFAVEVTVTFMSAPIQQYEQGGITWYSEGRPVFKLVHEHIDGAEWIIPSQTPAAARAVRLRLVVDGRDWSAQYQDESQGEFREVATGQLPPPADDQISIQCYDGPPDAEHWIRFDDFRIVQLPD